VLGSMVTIGLSVCVLMELLSSKESYRTVGPSYTSTIWVG